MTEKTTVLLVEDEESLLTILQEEFEFNGYHTLIANNGIAALSVFEKVKIDLIVTDSQMPACNGPELVRKVRAINTTVPIVMMTGYSEMNDSSLKDIGVSKVFQKPVSLNVLFGWIKAQEL